MPASENILSLSPIRNHINSDTKYSSQTYLNSLTEKQDEYKHNIGLAEEIKGTGDCRRYSHLQQWETLAAVIEEVCRYADDIIVGQ